MARRNGRNPTRASLYDFRDLDLMLHIAEQEQGVKSVELADLLGFGSGGEDGARHVGIRLAWMRRYGMVMFDDKERTWQLTQGGHRVTNAHLRAPELRVIERLDDAAMVEAMAQVTSRYQRGDQMLANMMRREWLFGTKRR